MAFCFTKKHQNKIHPKSRFSETKYVSTRVGVGSVPKGVDPAPNYATSPFPEKKHEKKFIYKVGGITWKSFEDSKKYIRISDKVMKWDDEAGKKAFFAARTWFWSDLTGDIGSGYYLPPLNPDLYIDNVDWGENDGDDEDDEKESILCISDTEGDDEDRYEVVNGRSILIPESYFVPLDQIKATGWDDDDCFVPKLVRAWLLEAAVADFYD